MSKGRMQDLLAAFREEGWDVADRDNLFAIEDEVVRWKIANETSGSTITLEFYVIGNLGERSYDLNDIHYCEDCNLGHKLIFDKRTSATWLDSVEAFVRKSCQTPMSSQGSVEKE